MKKQTTLLMLIIATICSYGQSQGEIPKNIYESKSMRKAPSLKSRGDDIFLLDINKNEHTEEGKQSKNHKTLSDEMASNELEQSFDVVTNLRRNFRGNPSMAVGPDHIFFTYREGFSIYDKKGNDLLGALSLRNIFNSRIKLDNITISHDQAADRWVITRIGRFNTLEVAISEGADPITSEWTVYVFDGFEFNVRLSVWSDAYYITAKSGLYALDRDAMLAGDTSVTIIRFELPGANLALGRVLNAQVFNVSSDRMPAKGNVPIVYMQDEETFSNTTRDHLKIWTANVDFDTPEDSRISQPSELDTSPFTAIFNGGLGQLAQPDGGKKIDAQDAAIMNQAQFRKFDTYNSAVFNFTINVGVGQQRAAIRWYELRQSGDGQPWTIYQEGTYTSPDNKHAWMASMSIDALGNIGLGYTGMGGTTDTFVSSYFTGRSVDDPLNSMTISETLIAEGKENIPNYLYGYFSKMDVDPTTDRKLWFVTEYMGANGRSNVAGSFQVGENFDKDVAITDIDLPEEGVLSNGEEITVTLANFGGTPISNLEVSYQIDSNPAVVETFTGTLEPNTSSKFSFATIADLSEEGLTYTISANVELSGDKLLSNNQRTQEITSLFANDIGVIEVVSPDTDGNESQQIVKVLISNFGESEQSNFDVSYTINGGTPVIETFTDTILPLKTIEYRFTSIPDLTNLGTYTISSATMLPTDTRASNDSTEKAFDILPGVCLTVSNNETQIIPDDSVFPRTAVSSIQIDEDFVITDVNVTVNIEHEEAREIYIRLKPAEESSVFGDIRLLDARRLPRGIVNFTNTTFDDDAEISILDGIAPYTGSFISMAHPNSVTLSSLDGTSPKGEWILNVSNFSSPLEGKLLDWKLDICGYKVLTLDIEENEVKTNESLVILDRGDNQFEIKLNTTKTTEVAEMSVYNMLGKRISSHQLENKSGTYLHLLDMSQVSSGIYFVRLNDNSLDPKTKRFFVK